MKHNSQTFKTIVQCLNEGLEDTRLESREQTVHALFELKDYLLLTEKKDYTIFICHHKHPQGGLKVYFEV